MTYAKIIIITATVLIIVFIFIIQGTKIITQGEIIKELADKNKDKSDRLRKLDFENQALVEKLCSKE